LPFETVERNVNQMKKFVPIIFLLVIITFAGCKKIPTQAEKDLTEIEQYAKDNGLNGAFTGSGLYYVIRDAGTGGHPTANTKVTVGFKGYYLSGTVFDENDYATFKRSHLIKGWQEGIPMVGEGGDITLLIPYDLAYNDGIRVFDIKLYPFSK